MGFGRIFRLREGITMEVRAEFQNIFNRVDLNAGLPRTPSRRRPPAAAGIVTGGFGYINATSIGGQTIRSIARALPVVVGRVNLRRPSNVMYRSRMKCIVFLAAVMLLATSTAPAQMGRTWPSEKKIVPTRRGSSSVTFPHQHGRRLPPIQDLSDASPVDRRRNMAHLQGHAYGSQAFAVNERMGQIIQVTESGFSGMLCVGHKTTP